MTGSSLSSVAMAIADCYPKKHRSWRQILLLLASICLATVVVVMLLAAVTGRMLRAAPLQIKQTGAILFAAFSRFE